MAASSASPRIVILADHPDPTGGAPEVAIESAAALARCGAAVTFIHAVDHEPDPRLEAAGIRILGLGLRDVWDLPLSTAAATGIWHREAAQRLGRVLAGLTGPAVLHVHQWTRSLSPSVFPVLAGTGHPVAVTLHDYFMACPNGVYFRFDKGEPCSLRPLSAACLAAPCDPRSFAHKAVRVARSAALRIALGPGLHAIHVSDRGRDTIAPFLPAGTIHHRVDNPVDVTDGLPASPLSWPVFAFIGRLTVEKGADLVAAAGRRAGVKTLFIGEGPAEAAIRAADPGADILGWRSRTEVKALLHSRITAVVAPSRWYETGPLTVYEAMASGLPVIASRRSGAAEKVADGETGFVVEPEIDPVAEAMRRLADVDVARRMGAAARDRYWAAPLSAEAHAGCLLKVYDEMSAPS